jgi:hypothetical protein
MMHQVEVHLNEGQYAALCDLSQELGRTPGECLKAMVDGFFLYEKKFGPLSEEEIRRCL